MKHAHFVVPLLGELWWEGLIFSIILILFAVWAGKKFSDSNQALLGKIFGTVFLAFAIVIHFYEWNTGRWNIHHSLPLQLCALSGILSGLIFFFPSQRLFELLVFWGIPGAVHSLLTPEMSHGYSPFIAVHYYLSHAGIIVSAIFLPLAFNRKLRPGSWIQNFLITLMVVLLVGGINYISNSNYMYLCQKPLAENPLVIGDWPWYVCILMLAGLIHFLLVYLIYKKLNWVAEKKPSI